MRRKLCLRFLSDRRRKNNRTKAGKNEGNEDKSPISGDPLRVYFFFFFIDLTENAKKRARQIGDITTERGCLWVGYYDKRGLRGVVTVEIYEEGGGGALSQPEWESPVTSSFPVKLETMKGIREKKRFLRDK